MKFRYKNFIMAGMIPVVIAGCASSNQGKKITVSQLETIMPGADSVVNLDVTFNIPRYAFSKRTRLIMVPQFVSADSMVAECNPVILDAPIYHKKNEMKKKLSGHVDIYGAEAVRVNPREDMEIKYSTTLNVPSDFEGGKVIAVVSTDGCGECEIADTLDMAYVSDISSLVTPKTNYMSQEFVIRPKTVEGSGEAMLQFGINRSDINLELGSNEEEMNNMLKTLGGIMTDSLATMRGLKIDGMASADGAYSLNLRLAKKRAASAADWLMDRIPSSSKYDKIISVGSVPEGWEPVLLAMKADGHKGAAQVEEIMEKYKDYNDDVAERYIRRLDCWEDIKNKYLQSGRRVVYVYQYSLKSFTTDKELLEMYGKRPDAFNEDELLKVATLKQSESDKAQVYETTLRYFPNSQVAANNLSVMLMEEGNIDKAEGILDSLEVISTDVANTRSALYINRGNYDAAVNMIEGREDASNMKYNLAIAEARRRNYEKAYSLIQGYKDSNAAVIALCAGHKEDALAIMQECGISTGKDEYVMALIYARMNMEEEMLIHLAEACKDENFKERASKEADFMPYANNEKFHEIVK